MGGDRDKIEHDGREFKKIMSQICSEESVRESKIIKLVPNVPNRCVMLYSREMINHLKFAGFFCSLISFLRRAVRLGGFSVFGKIKKERANANRLQEHGGADTLRE